MLNKNKLNLNFFKKRNKLKFLNSRFIFTSLKHLKKHKTPFFCTVYLKFNIQELKFKKFYRSNANLLFFNNILKKKKILTNNKLNYFKNNIISLNVVNNVFLINNFKCKYLNLINNYNLKSVLKKKYYSYSFLKNNFFLFYRERQLKFYNTFFLDFIHFRKISKKKNFNRNNLISVSYLSRIVKKKF